MEYIEELLNEYKKTNNNLLSVDDDKEGKNKRERLSWLASTLDEQFKNEVSRGNTDESFIKLYAEFGSLIFLNSTLGKNEANKEVNIDRNEYNLSSSKMVSKYTKETHDISNFCMIEKVKIIYNHTDKIVGLDDELIRENCKNRLDKYLSKCSERQYKKIYGDNWKNIVSDIYVKAYFGMMQQCISNAVKEVDIDNKEKYDKLSHEYDVLSKENVILTKEIENLKQEVSSLVEEISKIRQDNKKDLNQYRESIFNLINTEKKDKNFEFTPEEKSKILGALGIKFEYDETKQKGRGNYYNLVVESNTSVEQVARQMLICKNLGIDVSATFNNKTLYNTSFEDEQQVLDSYNSSMEQHKHV